MPPGKHPWLYCCTYSDNLHLIFLVCGSSSLDNMNKFQTFLNKQDKVMHLFITLLLIFFASCACFLCVNDLAYILQKVYRIYNLSQLYFRNIYALQRKKNKLYSKVTLPPTFFSNHPILFPSQPSGDA